LLPRVRTGVVSMNVTVVRGSRRMTGDALIRLPLMAESLPSVPAHRRPEDRPVDDGSDPRARRPLCRKNVVGATDDQGLVGTSRSHRSGWFATSEWTPGASRQV
jgi:hypothetical protein